MILMLGSNELNCVIKLHEAAKLLLLLGFLASNAFDIRKLFFNFTKFIISSN